MKLDTKTLLIILAAVVVAAGLYWYFFTGAQPSAPLSVSAGQNEAQAKFQSLIGQLDPVSFDVTIFSDPRFTSLTDLATPIAPEVAGRVDPFAPIPGVSGK